MKISYQTKGVVILFLLLISQKICAQQEVMDSLEKVIKKPLDNKTMAASLIQLARLQNAFGIGTPEEKLLKGLAISKSIKDSTLIAKAYESFAIMNERLGNLELAMQYADSSSRIVKIIKDSVRNVTLQMITGELYRRKAKYAEALLHFSEAVNYAEGLKDASYLSRAYNALAIYYVDSKDYQNGLKIHQKALKINRQLQNKYYIQNSLGNIGIVYRELKQFDKALINHKEAYKMVIELNDSTEISYLLNEIGVDYRGLGKIDSGINYISSSIAIREQMNEKGEIAYSYSNIAQCFANKNDLKNAELFYKKGIAVSKEIKNNKQLCDISLNLSELYHTNNMNDSAFKYSKFYNLMRDSLLAEDNQSIIQDLTIKYNIKEKDLKIREQSFSLKVRNYILGGFTLLVAVIAFSFHNRQRRKKAEYESNLKQMELKSLEQSITKLLEGEEKERKRLAAELHDGVGQKLTVLKMYLGSNNAPEREINMLTDAMDDIRKMSHNLMPSALDKGLVAALTDITVKVNMSGKVQCDLDNLLENPLKLTIEKEQAIYRIVQEITNNILKHAKATRMNMLLIDENHQLEIEITDNGIGIDPENITNSKGIGWSNINTRCKLIGATFTAQKLEAGSMFKLVVA